MLRVCALMFHICTYSYTYVYIYIMYMDTYIDTYMYIDIYTCICLSLLYYIIIRLRACTCTHTTCRILATLLLLMIEILHDLIYLNPGNCCSLVYTSTRQLPLKIPQIPSNRDCKALKNVYGGSRCKVMQGLYHLLSSNQCYITMCSMAWVHFGT